MGFILLTYSPTTIRAKRVVGLIVLRLHPPNNFLQSHKPEICNPLSLPTRQFGPALYLVRSLVVLGLVHRGS